MTLSNYYPIIQSISAKNHFKWLAVYAFEFTEFIHSLLMRKRAGRQNEV
jgi:hypothetical protein